MTDEEKAYWATVKPEILGVLTAGLAVVGGLVNQKAVNREKLIDYLLQSLAQLPPEERASPHGWTVSFCIEMLEMTQFPGQS